VKPLVDALKQKVTEIKVLLDGGAVAAAGAQMASFYAKTDVQAVFDDAIANIAQTIFATADNCFHSSTPVYDYPGGAL
jgi:L-rhamnose isomerase